MDCLEGLKTLPDNYVDCCVTSPPYYGLRDYGHEGQIGLEETPEEYVAKMVEVFTEVKRVLKKEGTLWLNLGDSYNAGRNGGHAGGKDSGFQPVDERYVQRSGSNVEGLKPKDLIGIPWMVAFALRSSGWYLRQDIIWSKPNPMPESVTDRCTKSHEYIFLLSKSGKYYYDAESIKTDLARTYNGPQYIGGKKGRSYDPIEGDPNYRNGNDHWGREVFIDENCFANKRSVWTVTTRPYSEAHFATFPERLITDCIKAGCPEFICNKCGRAMEKIVKNTTSFQGGSGKAGRTADEVNASGKWAGKQYGENLKLGPVVSTEIIGLTDCGCNAGFSGGIVLDPFMGAGTTALVARKLNRNYIGFELNPQYIEIANKRLFNELGMFL